MTDSVTAMIEPGMENGEANRDTVPMIEPGRQYRTVRVRPSSAVT